MRHNTTSSTPLVSKLPTGYVQRTLARLLPPPAVAQTLSRDQLIRLAEHKKKLSKEIEHNPLRFWHPNAGGQTEFVCESKPYRVRGYFAGNKSGKTTAGAVLVLERLLGRPLWDVTNRSATVSPQSVPVRACCFAEDFDSHKEVTLPTIRTWCPHGEIKHEQKNPAGHVTEIEFKNGSILSFRTYDQGSPKAEGKDWVMVWCDEPPPRDIYVAIFRGLVVLDGVLIITATLLKETWLYDEALEHDFVKIYEGSIHDNTWLSDRAKADFLGALTDDERQVRESGKPSSLVGLVYKQLRDGEPYVVPLHDVPADYPIIVGVDPHERRPVYVEWAYIDPDDGIVWFDWALASGSENEIFDTLNAHEANMPSKPVLCIMDPNRGRAKQIGRGYADGTCWAEIFEEHGYNVYFGVDELRAGHTALRTFLTGDKPRMRWMETCRGKGGPVYQMMRYSWEEYKFGKKDQSPKEKPKDNHKDFPDIHRYVAMADLSFNALQHGDEVLGGLPGEDDYSDHTDAKAYV